MLQAIRPPESATDAVGADRSAAPPTLAAVEASALVDELSRRHDEWCSALKSLQVTLASVDRACQAAVDEEHDPANKVSDLVERIVAAATTEADATIRQVRGEAEREVAEHREQLQTARAELEHEQTIRLHAEAARGAAERLLAEAASTHASQVRVVQTQLEAERAESARLWQQLDAEHVERVRLAAALDAIQRTVSSVETVRAPSELPISVPRTDDRPASAHANSVIESYDAANASQGAASVPEGVIAPPVDRNLTLVRTRPPADAEAQDDLVDYAKELLNQVEAMYCADLESSRSSADVVNRLTDHLRYARTAFARRVNAADGEPTLFDDQVVMLLDAKATTAFGGHLAFSAYQVCSARDTTQPRSA